MSYRLPETASYETLIDYVVGAHTAVEADDDLAAIAAPFVAKRAELLALRDHRDLVRWHHIACRKKVDLRDVQWDAAVGDLSGRAFLESGKDPNAGPYADLFGPRKADELRQLGPARAAAAATLILGKGALINNPALVAPLAKLDDATKKLQSAETDRVAARNEALMLDIPRAQQVDAVELLIAHAEVAILTQFPGRDDLVRAVLAPPRKEPKDDGGSDPAAVPA